MATPKEAASDLVLRAKDKSVRFPKIWDDSKTLQACGAIVMMHRSVDGFDLDAALEALIEKYGQEDAAVKKSPSKKRKGDSENDDESAPSSNKKIKKTDIVANEGNRSVAEAIKEMADLNYKNKDMRKGGVFSKAAKAIRECETEITTMKEAMALKGVGKGIAGYIMEKIETGNIQKLEELRSGYA